MRAHSKNQVFLPLPTNQVKHELDPLSSQMIVIGGIFKSQN